MKTKSSLIIILLSMLVLTQCKQEQDLEFSIRKDGVGYIEKETPFSKLETLYASDSVVQDSSYSLNTKEKKTNIFEPGGKLLLTVTATSDSVPKIGIIRVQDARYRTEKGLNLQSTFKDIKDNYEIRKIITSLRNVVIFLKGEDFYITIDREELPASLRYTTGIDIEAVQIPDDARIKYLMVGWE